MANANTSWQAVIVNNLCNNNQRQNVITQMAVA
jgi:hypothetical protein